MIIFNDFIDLEEVDHDDAKMILFAYIFFLGRLKSWLKNLPARSIADYDAYDQAFLDRWEYKKNSLHILT